MVQSCELFDDGCKSRPEQTVRSPSAAVHAHMQKTLQSACCSYEWECEWSLADMLIRSSQAIYAAPTEGSGSSCSHHSQHLISSRNGAMSASSS